MEDNKTTDKKPIVKVVEGEAETATIAKAKKETTAVKKTSENETVNADKPAAKPAAKGTKKKSNKNKKTEMLRRKKNMRLVLVNLVAMLIVVIAIPFVALSWLDSYTLHGETIEVPNICGIQLKEASSLLREKSLDFEIVDYKYVKGAKDDEVLEQRPVAASRVKEGRKIELTMSSSHEPMQVIPPVVDNSSLREAQARLRASGFKLGENVYIPGEKDWVYSLLCGKDTLRNGMQIPMGSTVVLVIGGGDEEENEGDIVVDENWFE